MEQWTAHILKENIIEKTKKPGFLQTMIMIDQNSKIIKNFYIEKQQTTLESKKILFSKQEQK